MALYDTDEIIEKVILVGVAFDSSDETESSLDELSELAKTAGAVTVGRMIQTRENFHPGTYIGKGKIEELRVMIDELDATGIICDDELSPAQFKNLEDELLCTCYNVSENEVRRVITENQLTTVEEVTNYTKAGGGCGRCKGKIQAILDELHGAK